MVITVDTSADETAADPGRYVLALPPDPQKVQGRNADPTTGDLNLTAPTVLRGAGRDRTALDANGIDRVLRESGIAPWNRRARRRCRCARPGCGDFRYSTIRANTSGIASANCATAFAPIVSEGGKTSDDASCELTGAGDSVVS